MACSGASIGVRDSKNPSGPALIFPLLPSGPLSIVMAARIAQASSPE
nr:DUF397 domain-containing protein [Actinophytocola oryzae]